MAQALGLGREYACLPMAGSFYYAPEALNGKVYRVQNPSRLPFAAVHGDPDIRERGKTRFGPTTLMLPRLERRNRASGREFFEALHFDHQMASALWDLIKDPDLRNAILRNVLYEVPGLNRRLFIKEVKKIVPSLTAADIVYAEGCGGVRPLLIDRTTGRLRPGEALSGGLGGALGGTKLTDGAGIVFNLVPAAGGTACLGSGETDMRTIARRLGARIDEQAFERELLTGYADTRDEPVAAEGARRALARAV
jgi:malate dehydrogenase (quinone)